MGRQWDLMCALSELESSLKTPFRYGIDPTVAAFAGAALPVKMPSEGSEEVSSCCGCPHPCKCNPYHCEGFAIDLNTVTLIASVEVEPPVKMPLEGSEKSVKAEREGIHPKLEKSIEAER